MEQQNEKLSFEEVKDALKTISKYCSEINAKDCNKGGCLVYQLLGDCPTGTFTSSPEDWKID